MSMHVMGEEMDGNVRAWRDGQRRVGGILALAVAAIALVAALVVYFTAGSVEWLYWALVALLAIVLVFVLVLLFLQPASAEASAEAAAEAEPHLGPAAPATLAEATKPEPAPAPVPPPAEPTVPTITLRCGDCGTIFDLPDTGERPLYHTCPGCGAEGVLREASAAAPAAAPQPLPPPGPQMKPAPGAPPPPAPPAAPAVKRLKLRCGNCKQVFAIEDTGERPLRRPCPYCGRMGEIR